MNRSVGDISCPLYSPGLVPANYFMFHKVKPILKWNFFFYINDNEKNVTTELNALPLGTSLVTTL